MGIITRANIHPWYENLAKSLLTPPDISFAIVWPILYLLLAIVGLNLFIKKKNCSLKQRVIYSVQLVLNWLWTPVFFSFHWVDIAYLILVSMVILTTILICDLYNNQRKLAYLLIPYLIWILFATYLNGVIWLAS